MKRTGFVYFMSNSHNNVLYVGVTNNLLRRVAEHKAKINKGFTYKYNCDKLVYFEEYALVVDAIAREKQIKNWKREWKNELIKKDNPDWNDLSETIGVTEELIRSTKEYYQGIAGQARNDGSDSQSLNTNR
jgi:putative endonuclease